MGLFKLEVHKETQTFIATIVDRVCKTVDNLTAAVREKKISAKGSFEIEGG